eukprot:GFUD01007272.1.p1 GENE.GFUD01007272.1~~GFUD01007272.1.p1  ORF type:complete len:950 (+),score=360.85 GFUD01007272.1:177-2852(+)
MEKELNDKNILISHLKKDLLNIQTDIKGKLESSDVGYIDEIKKLKERIDILLDEMEDIKKKNKELEAVLDDSKNNESRLSTKNEFNLKNTVENGEKDRQTLEEKLTLDYEKKIEKISQDYLEVVENLKKGKSDIMKDLEQKNTLIDNLQTASLKKELEFKENFEKFNANESKISLKNEKIDNLEKEIGTLKTSNVLLENEMEECKKKEVEFELEKNLISQKADENLLESMRDMEERYTLKENELSELKNKIERNINNTTDKNIKILTEKHEAQLSDLDEKLTEKSNRILEYKRKIEELETNKYKEEQIESQSRNYDKIIENKEKEKENMTNDLRKSENRITEMSTELLNMNLEYNNLKNEYKHATEQLKYLTSKLEQKQQELDESKLAVDDGNVKNDFKEKITQLNVKIEELERKEMNSKKIMNEHQTLKSKLEKCEIELQSKEGELLNAKSMLKYSENRMVKIEEFVNSQKQRINALEEKLQESEQDKIDLAQKLKIIENDDTMQRVMEELRYQNQQETNRLKKEKEKVDRLSTDIHRLESEIESIKSTKYLDSQKMKLVVSNLEKEMKNESKCLKEEILRNKKLKKDLEEERNSGQLMQQELESQASQGRKERQKMNEDRKKLVLLTESLDLEKEKREDCERKLNKEARKQNEDINFKDRMQDLEMDVALLTKRNCILEDKLVKSHSKMSELEDVSAENKELQEAILKKDLIIEDMERHISTMLQEGEMKMKRTLDKMRTEYEIMARSAVSTKLRKMNDYLSEKFKNQEELDNERDSIAKGIQIDLEERLTSSLNEVYQIKEKLKRADQELKALRQHSDSKEKQVKAEQLLRRQLEQQVDKLANQQISHRLARGSADNLARNSLETPVTSPEIWRERGYQSTSNLYYKS